jgi:hypothetical protein
MDGSLACAAAIVARTRQYSGVGLVLSGAIRRASVTVALPVGKANALAGTFIAPKAAQRRAASSTCMSASAAFAGRRLQFSIVAKTSTNKTERATGVRPAASRRTRFIESPLISHGHSLPPAAESRFSEGPLWLAEGQLSALITPKLAARNDVSQKRISPEFIRWRWRLFQNAPRPPCAKTPLWLGRRDKFYRSPVSCG